MTTALHSYRFLLLPVNFYRYRYISIAVLHRQHFLPLPLSAAASYTCRFLHLPLPTDVVFYRRRSVPLLFSTAGARSRLFLLPPFPIDVVFYRRHFQPPYPQLPGLWQS
jgi:hypothetical protein